MAAIFTPAANGASKGVLLGLSLLLCLGVGWWLLWPRTEYVRQQLFTIEQPVPFSHKHHVGGLGINCQFCHSSVSISADAGMPPTYTCMTCHAQIWTNADLLAPVRRSLAENKPIVWARVNNLPDYVGCSSCHGQIAQMPLTYKAASLTMQFCLNCHRNPGPQLRPESEIYNTEWVRGPDMPSPSAMAAQYGVPNRDLTECTICHR